MANSGQKNILITGSSKRVGKDLAVKFAQDGWSIALHYNTSKQEAYEFAKELLEITNVMVFQADLSEKSSARGLIKKINDEMGEVNLLVNNASFHKNDYLNSVTHENLEKHFFLHVNSVIYLSQAMLEQKIKGDIINIIDSDITRNMKDFFSYSLSKKSLYELTKMLALSMAPDIKVNAVAPGPILFKDGQNLKLFNDLIDKSPLRKSVKLQELYDTIDFLVKSTSVTGQTIYLDAGRHLI